MLPYFLDIILSCYAVGFVASISGKYFVALD